MKLSAVIFDLDGTIIEDEDEWGEAFGNVLKTLGVKNVPQYPHVGGIGIEENWPKLLKKYNLTTDKSVKELADETRRQYYKLIGRVTLRRGFEDFTSQLKESKVRIALATSSIWETVQKLFDKLQIEERFDSVTTGEEVTYKKPDPQIFEIAAEKLGVTPENCLVFEDSQAGIAAAHAAAMKVIAMYRNNKHKSSLRQADALVKDFSEVTPELIASI